MTNKLGYNSDSQRYSLNDLDLHAGDGVTVIGADGAKTETQIEYDNLRRVWYLVGFEGQSPEDLTVAAD
jgi:hypothetical protein